MRFGMVFPNELGASRELVVQYAHTVEDAGFSYLLAFDHVLGADTETRPDWSAAYSIHNPFHEPFVLFGHLSALTRLHFMTGVIVLPQRQTALVAKQAAELAILSGDRLRLGVGIGWNELEYEALGVPFAGRAARLEEQIALLRALWTEHSIDFTGSFHRIDRAGLLPQPTKPISIWIGTFGRHPAALERIGRLADGWNPLLEPGDDLTAARSIVDRGADQAGRDRGAIELEGRMRIPHAFDPDQVRATIERWLDVGATYLAFDTLHVGLTHAEHIERAALVGEICREFATLPTTPS